MLEGLMPVELTATQREQMASLVQQLNTTRVVAENFVSYFARELGVNLQVYQFDTDRLVFMPVVPSYGFDAPQAAGVAEVIPNGQHEM